MAESSMVKRMFRNCAVIAGLIERRVPGQEKTGRQVSFNADLIYDVLRKYEPNHILLRAAREEAARGLTDIRRLADFLVSGAGASAPSAARPDLAVCGRHHRRYRQGAGGRQAVRHRPRRADRGACGRSGGGPDRHGAVEIVFAASAFEPDPSGAVWCPGRSHADTWRTCISRRAAPSRGAAPCCRPTTPMRRCSRLEAVIARLRPDTVVSLGDGFHDRRAGEALEAALAGGPGAHPALRWVWIEGNRDPVPPTGLGGEAVPALELGRPPAAPSCRWAKRPKLTGHLHPKARVAGTSCGCRGPAMSATGRCSLPAFGTYTGGLNVLDPAIGACSPRLRRHAAGAERPLPVPDEGSSLAGVGSSAAAGAHISGEAKGVLIGRQRASRRRHGLREDWTLTTRATRSNTSWTSASGCRAAGRAQDQGQQGARLPGPGVAGGRDGAEWAGCGLRGTATQSWCAGSSPSCSPSMTARRARPWRPTRRAGGDRVPALPYPRPRQRALRHGRPHPRHGRGLRGTWPGGDSRQRLGSRIDRKRRWGCLAGPVSIAPRCRSTWKSHMLGSRVSAGRPAPLRGLGRRLLESASASAFRIGRRRGPHGAHLAASMSWPGSRAVAMAGPDRVEAGIGSRWVELDFFKARRNQTERRGNAVEPGAVRPSATASLRGRTPVHSTMVPYSWRYGRHGTSRGHPAVRLEEMNAAKLISSMSAQRLLLPRATEMEKPFARIFRTLPHTCR